MSSLEGVKFGKFTFQSFGEEKFGKWMDQAKNNDYKVHVMPHIFVLCTMVKLKVSVCFHALCS